MLPPKTGASSAERDTSIENGSGEGVCDTVCDGVGVCVILGVLDDDAEVVADGVCTGDGVPLKDCELVLRALLVGRELRLIDCDCVGEPLGERSCEELSDDVALNVGVAEAEFERSSSDWVCVLLTVWVDDDGGDGVCVRDVVAEVDPNTPVAVWLAVCN